MGYGYILKRTGCLGISKISKLKPRQASIAEFQSSCQNKNHALLFKGRYNLYGQKVASLKTCPYCSIQLGKINIGGKERIACSTCDFVHWDNPKPVTATVIEIDGGIVLVKRNVEPFVDDWCLPGGFIEAAEHPAQAAEREVLEETGLVVEVTQLLEAGAPGRGINVVILFYEARPVGGKMAAGDDASDVRSFREDELPKNIAFEQHRKIIRNWFAKRSNSKDA